MAAISHTSPGLPATMLSISRWCELHDFIELAKDSLGDNPADFNRMFFENCEVQLRSAVEIVEARRRHDRPWAEPEQDESATIIRIREAMRIITHFARVIDAQAPKEGQFGVPSLALDMACAELTEALRLEGAA